MPPLPLSHHVDPKTLGAWEGLSWTTSASSVQSAYASFAGKVCKSGKLPYISVAETGSLAHRQRGTGKLALEGGKGKIKCDETLSAQ